MTSRRFPDFYILGAPKAGTSSLAQYLDEHPGIFVSKPKEPRFFAEDFADREVSDEEAYLDLFDAAGDDAILGEATTDYLVSEVAVDRILAKRPDAKFVVMLRNPIQMVPAMHAQERKNGYETVADPAKAWALLAERKAGRNIPSLCNEPKRLFYDERCRLGEQIQRLKSKVAEDRLLIIFMEDFAADTERVYREAQTFIGISSYEPRDFPIVNQRHHIKHPIMLQLWKLGMTAKDKLGLKTNLGVLSKVQAMGLSSEPTDRSSSADRLAFQHVLKDAFEADINKLAALTGEISLLGLNSTNPPVRNQLPPPLVSVVIPVYNRADLVADAIRGCFDQSYQAFEIILVDDGSTDDLASAIAPFSKDQRLRLVRHQRNQGVSAARNSGVRAARGKFVAFLDSDDVWLPTKLERQISHIASRSTPNIICGTLTEVRSGGRVRAIRPKRRKPRDVALGDYLFVDRVQRPLPVVDWPAGSLKGGCFAQTSSLLLPAALAVSTPFRTALDQYEDMAFLLDLDRKGVDFLLVEEPLTRQNDDDRPGRLGAVDDLARGMRFLDAVGDALSEDARLAFEVTHLAHLQSADCMARAMVSTFRAFGRGAIASRSLLGILSRSLMGQASQKALRDRLAVLGSLAHDRKTA